MPTSELKQEYYHYQQYPSHLRVMPMAVFIWMWRSDVEGCGFGIDGYEEAVNGWISIFLIPAMESFHRDGVLGDLYICLTVASCFLPHMEHVVPGAMIPPLCYIWDTICLGTPFHGRQMTLLPLQDDEPMSSFTCRNFEASGNRGDGEKGGDEDGFERRGSLWKQGTRLFMLPCSALRTDPELSHKPNATAKI